MPSARVSRWRARDSCEALVRRSHDIAEAGEDAGIRPAALGRSASKRRSCAPGYGGPPPLACVQSLRPAPDFCVPNPLAVERETPPSSRGDFLASRGLGLWSTGNHWS